MSQTQFLKMLEKEIQKINKVIDRKIMQGQDYRKEARDHRLMLRRMNYHTRRTFKERMINLFFRKDIRSIYA
ncbi:MAG TPA: hypothetical protein VJC14_00205 [Candidatus Paceibacterota bacterium]